MGDVHPSGNPHYWLSPDKGRRIAQEIHQKLAEITPGDAAYSAERYGDFERRRAAAEKRGEEGRARSR